MVPGTREPPKLLARRSTRHWPAVEWRIRVKLAHTHAFSGSTGRSPLATGEATEYEAHAIPHLHKSITSDLGTSNKTADDECGLHA